MRYPGALLYSARHNSMLGGKERISRRVKKCRSEIMIALLFLSGPPEPPTNCSVVNQTTDSLMVECLPGFNGGMDQDFVMEVADLQSRVMLTNATERLPEFTVGLSCN